MLSFSVFEVLLFEGRLVLGPAQRDTGSESVKLLVKNQRNIQLLLKLVEKWLT